MERPVRILYAAAPGSAGDWRAAFDLAQAAAAFDVPIEIACCGDGLAWLRPSHPEHALAAAAFASLGVLGVTDIRVPAEAVVTMDAVHGTLAVLRLDVDQWQAWLRQGPLQVW